MLLQVAAENFSFEFDGDLGGDSLPTKDECNNSVCFRPASSYRLILKEGEDEIQRINVVLPNKTVIGKVNIDRTVFVTKVTKVDFEEGMLTKVDIDKPSEALAGFQIPIDIVNAIIAIPAELVQFKIDTSGQDEKLHKARIGELKAREDLLELQRQLMERNAAVGASQEPSGMEN